MRTGFLGIAPLVSHFLFPVLAALVLVGNSGLAKRTVKDPSRGAIVQVAVEISHGVNRTTLIAAGPLVGHQSCLHRRA